MRRGDDRKLIEALAHRLNIPVEGGREGRATIHLDDKTYVVVTLQVIANLPGIEHATERRAVLGLLDREPWRAERCGCRTKQRQRFSSGRKDCENKPTGALVLTPLFGPGRRYELVCSAHATHNDYGTSVLGHVPLAADELARARRLWEQQQAEQRKAAHQAALALPCRRCAAVAGAPCTYVGKADGWLKPGDKQNWLHTERENDGTDATERKRRQA